MLRIYVKDDTDATCVSYRVSTDSAGRSYVDISDNILLAEIPEEIPDEKILRLNYLDNIQTPPKRSRGVYRHQSAQAIIRDLSPKIQAQPGTLGLIITGEPTPDINPLSVFLDMRELYMAIMKGVAVEKGLLIYSWENEQKEPEKQKDPPDSDDDFGDILPGRC